MNRLLQMENLERHYETPAGVVRLLMVLVSKFMKVNESFSLVLQVLEKPHY